MSKLILPAALLAVLLCPAEVLARDYGQRGTVFPVIERDLLEQIHSRLTQMERSGETARLNEDLKRRTIARVGRPDPVAGIVRASEARRWRHRRQWMITIAAHSRPALHQAAMCGADAALLSPVFATASHPDEQPLGPEGFNLLAAQAGLPVYALGGINANNATRLLSGRAAGIAGITTFAD